MFKIVKTDIFSSDAQTLVNAVNSVGVMGGGLAALFKDRFPEMYIDYVAACETGELKPGHPHLWKGEEKWVLNFPTMDTLAEGARLDWIEQGLITVADNYRKWGVESLSFPKLGCGIGGLDWEEVYPLMVRRIGNLPIPVYVHDYP